MMRYGACHFTASRPSFREVGVDAAIALHVVKHDGVPQDPSRRMPRMALVVGTRLGSYDITAPIGAGGMGEVYRAKDAS